MTKCLNMNNDTSLRSSNWFGTSLWFTPKRLGNRLSNKLRLTTFVRRPCFKASTKRGKPRMYYVGSTIYTLGWIRKNQLLVGCKTLLWVLSQWSRGDPWRIGWGWSLAWWVRWVVHDGGWLFVLYTWRYLAPMGPCLPSAKERFLFGSLKMHHPNGSNSLACGS